MLALGMTFRVQSLPSPTRPATVHTHMGQSHLALLGAGLLISNSPDVVHSKSKERPVLLPKKYCAVVRSTWLSDHTIFELGYPVILRITWVVLL